MGEKEPCLPPQLTTNQAGGFLLQGDVFPSIYTKREKWEGWREGERERDGESESERDGEREGEMVRVRVRGMEREREGQIYRKIESERNGESERVTER